MQGNTYSVTSTNSHIWMSLWGVYVIITRELTVRHTHYTQCMAKDIVCLMVGTEEISSGCGRFELALFDGMPRMVRFMSPG